MVGQHIVELVQRDARDPDVMRVRGGHDDEPAEHAVDDVELGGCLVAQVRARAGSEQADPPTPVERVGRASDDEHVRTGVLDPSGVHLAFEPEAVGPRGVCLVPAEGPGLWFGDLADQPPSFRPHGSELHEND